MEQSLQQWIELIGLVTQIFEFLNNFISNKKDYIFVLLPDISRLLTWISHQI